MKIATTSDIHYPTYSELFWSEIQKIDNPDLFLLAGDVCEAFHPENYKKVIDILDKKGVKCPIVGVFGNTEFDQDYEKIRDMCKGKIVFLKDEMLNLEIDGKKIVIIGTRGGLDKPTSWQLRNIPNIKEIYKKSYDKVTKLLEQAKMFKPDITILMMHYSPTRLTVKGEPNYSYPGLSYKAYEETIKKFKPTFVIHGHAHSGTKFGELDDVPIYNVALPLNMKIIEIDTENPEKEGLMKFI